MDEMPANVEILPPEGESEPRRGTLAWVMAQGTIEREGEHVPACHRIPEDASLLPEPEGTRCRVVSADGTPCKGTRLRDLGLCMGHAGGGGTADISAMQRKGAESRHRLKVLRQTLGLSAARSADPRYAARMRAALRADDLARAVVDGPLDGDLGPVEKQRAALAVLDATFPLQSATVELSLDADPDDMSWKDMKRLAVSLLG